MSIIHAVIRNVLPPVFCDIKPDDFTIDAPKIESMINERTCAIVPVHVYGNICDTERIQNIADKYDLKVVYDAAHAFGVCRNGESVARFGDISVFSLHVTKVFHSIKGGAACIRDGDIAQKICSLKNFGITSTLRVKHIGANAKMNEFCAVMGICNLKHVEKNLIRTRLP